MMDHNVVIIGGGTAGMEAAGQLVKSGCRVTLIEKGEKTGGHVRNWHHLFPDKKNGSEVIEYLNKQIDHKNISVLTNTEISSVSRRKGSFTLRTVAGEELKADALVIATGFDLYRSEKKEEYGYGIYDNVITSADLENMFSQGYVRLTDGRFPQKIGMIHCVGSRDEKAGNLYCSKLCCVTAVKQAIGLKESLPDTRIFCFYMDMRMGGALYEELYREAQEKYGINFIRGKVSEVGVNINNRLIAKVEDTLAGRPLKMELDMLVLMAGMEMSDGGAAVAEMAGLNRGINRFFAPVDAHFGSNISNIEGIFYAGTCTAPMNITETISHARAAVADVIDYLNAAKE